MDGNKRRQAIIDILKNSLQPVSGTYLAKTLQVSRQVIVQDIALLRAGDYDIYSTHKGYVLNTQKVCKRIFKVHHDDNEVEKELSLIVDLGGYVEDVFVYHPQIEECDLVEKLIPLNNGIVWVVASDGNLWRIEHGEIQRKPSYRSASGICRL